MTIRKLENGKYEVDVDVGTDPDGKRDRRRARFRLLRDAKKQESEWLRMKDRRRGIVSGMTLSEFVEDCFWPAKKDLDDGTLMGYRRDVRNRILPSLGDLALEDIRRSDVQAMITSCPTRKVAQNARATLSSVLGLAVQMDYLEHNPAQGNWTYPKRKPKPAGHDGVWLQSFAEITGVLDRVHARYAGTETEAMFILGLGLGLRKGEILALTWEDVDFEGMTVHVGSTWTYAKGGMKEKATKTEKSTRDIPLPPSLAKRLEEFGPSKGPIVNIGGKRLGAATATNRVSAAVEELGIPKVTCKSMRHSFATSCIRAGMDVSVLSKVLGHTNTATTYNRYVRPMSGAVRDAMGSLEI